MTCADDAMRWAFAEGSLDAPTHEEIARHLEECDDCRDAVMRIEATRKVLRVAAGMPAPVDWRRADEAVMGAATVRAAKSARWRMPRWSYAAGLAIAAVLVFVWSPWRANETASTTAAATSSAPEVGAVLAEVSVEAADGASTESGSLVVGGSVRQNARIVTDERGSALVRLPEQSRARLGARTEATLARASREEIQIDLRRGNVVVRAAHVKRKAFLVDTPEAQVRVVGTAFRVARVEGQVTVSVAEGRVLVEPKGGDSRLVNAGERVVIGNHGQYLESAALRSEDSAAFAELGPMARVLPEPVHPRPTPATESGARTGPDVAVASASPRPTSSPETPPIPIEAAPREPAVQTDPPAIAPPQPEPQPAAVAAVKPGIPTTAEGLFLERAGEALKTGKCQNYLLGLQDVIEGTQDKGSRETAYILRARCFDEQLDPVAAAQEYRKYLQRFPAGRFADEARRGSAE